MPTDMQFVCAAANLSADILMGDDVSFVQAVAKDIAAGVALAGDIYKAMQILKPLKAHVLCSMRGGVPLSFNRSGPARKLKNGKHLVALNAGVLELMAKERKQLTPQQRRNLRVIAQQVADDGYISPAAVAWATARVAEAHPH